MSGTFGNSIEICDQKELVSCIELTKIGGGGGGGEGGIISFGNFARIASLCVG